MSLNLSAPINSLGYGVVGTNVALALECSGYAPALWPLGPIDCPIAHTEIIRNQIRRTERYNPKLPSLRIYHQFDLAQHVGKALHAAMPIFELDKFRVEELHHLKNQDVILVNSTWGYDVLVTNGIEPSKVKVVQLGVDTSIFFPRESAETEETVFLNVGKWEYRKGHDILIKAFEAAFSTSDKVRLIMACHNPCFRTKEEMDRYNGEWESLYKSSHMGDKIGVLTKRLENQNQLASLMSQVDCGVFPSRAEGWNLEALEMMAMGKHVIATNYSAHTAFCTNRNSLLINIDGLEYAHDGIWFRADHPGWRNEPGSWAHLGESQLEQLVCHMQTIHHLKQSGKLSQNEDGLKTAKSFSWKMTANDVVNCLGMRKGDAYCYG